MPPKYEGQTEPIVIPEIAEIEKRFTYHPAKGDQPDRYLAIREMAKNLAYTIYRSCPDSRERSSALTKLDEVVMHANAAIARNE
jgi:hypothetical protein